MSSPAKMQKSFLDDLFRLVGRQAQLFICAGFLILFILAGMIAIDVYLRQLKIDESERKAQNLASVVADQTDRALRSASSLVEAMSEALRKEKLHSEAGLKIAAGAANIETIANNRAPNDDFLQDVYILSARGAILTPGEENYPLFPGDYLKNFLDAMKTSTNEDIFVSEPFRSSTTGTWQLAVSKRIPSHEGQFIGVVMGIVKLSSLQSLLQKISIGNDGSLSVFRSDGSIIACFPQHELNVVTSIGQNVLREQYLEPRIDGVERLQEPQDRTQRVMAVVNSTQFQVASVVAVTMSDVIVGWTRQVEILGAAAGVLVLFVLLGAFGLAKRIEQLAAAREREVMQVQMSIRYEQFQIATDNIVQGLALYDEDDILIACNKRYAEIYGLPVMMTGPHVSRADSVLLSKEKLFGKLISKPKQEQDGATLTIHRLADGRLIAQRRKDLENGGYVSTHEDITERRHAEDKIREMATTDSLTGLSNRLDFKQRLEQALEEARRGNGHFAVLYLDLDRFKIVNDTLGHPVGDKLLQEVAQRIRSAVRKGDTIARLGGDEFAIIQRIENAPHDIMKLAERLISSLSEPFTIDENIIEIGTSIGISHAPNDSLISEQIIRNADVALYHSKMERGSYNFFKPSMDEDVQARRQMEKDLRIALAEKQFCLFFQPVVSAPDKTVLSFEALIRWNHPLRGNVSPVEFIPLAEENGLIVPIGEWVIEEACRQAAQWPDEINVAINVSAVQFKSPNLLKAIKDALASSGLHGSRLIVEVTESVLIKNTDQAIAILHAIKQMGISIAMDDFGTGYSSLSYLQKFPFDKIKIDRSFVSQINDREDTAAIVAAAVGLAKALGMQTVAEGVETDAQFERISALGCAMAQGYLISKPMPADDVHAFLGKEIMDRFAQSRERVSNMAGLRTNRNNSEIDNIAKFPMRRRDGKLTSGSMAIGKATIK